MAFSTTLIYQATASFRDVAGRPTSASIYVSGANASAWMTDPTAGLLSAWFTALRAMTDGGDVSESVSVVRKELAVNEGLSLRGNKAVINTVAQNGATTTLTIPCRIPTAFPLDSNGLTIDVDSTTPIAWQAFKDATLAVAITNQGSPLADFTSGEFND